MSEPRVPLKNAVAEEAVLYLPPAYRPGMRALIRQVYGSEIERLRAALEKAAKIWQCYQHEPERAADKMATVVMLALERSPDETFAHRDPTGTTREPPHCPSCSCGLEPLPMIPMPVEETTEHPCSFPGCIRDDEDHARHTEETTAVRTDSERLRWLANTVLACDYGDNHHPAKLVGWRVLEFISPVMYGASIAEAIDAAMAQEKPKRQPKETTKSL